MVQVSFRNERDTLIDDAERAERVTTCRRRGTACRIQQIRIDAVTPQTPEDNLVFCNGSDASSGTCSGVRGACGCVHAEVRAMTRLLLSDRLARLARYRLLTTLSPCTYCANLIALSSLVREVIYLKPLLHDLRGIQILIANCVEVRQA